MDKAVQMALAHQAEQFLASDLYKYVVAGIRAGAINVFVASKATDTDAHRDAKFLLGTVDLFERELVKLANALKVERAEEKRRERKKKP